MIKKCLGCGTILQSSNPEEVGYIPLSKIENSCYCERCFQITHYNKSIIIPLKGINDKIIFEVNKNAKYVFFLIDFLNINSETIATFKKIQSPKTLIISKLDVIPKSIKKNVITMWLQNNYDITEDIIYISSNKNINISKIPNILNSNNLTEAYILGYTNAGKSTLINKLSLKYNIVNNKITTSLIPNTTLDFIHLKLAKNLTIIDSPGFTMNETIYEDTEIDLIKRINPKMFLKPKTYQTKDITSLIIEDRLRINSNEKNSMTCYFSNNVLIEKVFSDNKNLLNEEHKVISIEENSDLVIKGLGFINIKKACELNIYSKYQNLIEIRKSMF